MKFRLALTILVLAISVQVLAGAESSGGGPGVFCPSTVANQPAVQLLDFYEGKIDGSLQIPESKTSYQKQLQNIQKKLNFDFSLQMDISRALNELLLNYRFLPAGVGILVPPDLGNDEAVLVPTGCTVGAIGYYEKSGILVISADAFNALSETQKAAFWIHEAFYKLARHYGHQYNSKTTRVFTAHLFSRNTTQQKLFELSEYGNWRIRGGVIPTFGMTWSPAVGKASWFVHTGVFAPVRLPKKKGEIELVMEAPLGALIYGDLSCVTLESIYNGPEIKTSSHNVGIKSFVSGILPEDCEVLRVNQWQDFGTSVPDFVKFTLFFNGEELLSGEANVGLGTDLKFPLYY